MKGKQKCKLQNLCNDASVIEKPPHNKQIKSGPIKGNPANKFVITIAAQKLICPHGNTYPKKAVAIIINHKATPEIHSICLG